MAPGDTPYDPGYPQPCGIYKNEETRSLNRAPRPAIIGDDASVDGFKFGQGRDVLVFVNNESQPRDLGLLAGLHELRRWRPLGRKGEDTDQGIVERAWNTRVP